MILALDTEPKISSRETWSWKSSLATRAISHSSGGFFMEATPMPIEKEELELFMEELRCIGRQYVQPFPTFEEWLAAQELSKGPARQ